MATGVQAANVLDLSCPYDMIRSQLDQYTDRASCLHEHPGHLVLAEIT